MNGVVARLAGLVPLGDFAREVATLATGTASGLAVVVLASPAITRPYTPDEVGSLAVYNSVLAVLEAELPSGRNAH